MTKDKKVLYATSLIIFAVFFSVLFVDVGRSSKIIAALLLLPTTPAVCLLIKKRSSVSINKREILLLISVIASLFAILMHMSGLFFEYYKNPYFVNLDILLKTILPLAAIIVGSEMIRHVLLSQKNKAVSFIAYLICVTLEILMFSSIAGTDTFNKFMDMVGMTFFPALSANVFYHFVSKNYGALPNIVYRLITTLYVYFVPTAVAMPDALSACIKIIFPILMIAFVSALYSKRKKNAVQKGKKLSLIATIISICVITSIAMLISCEFRYGAVVVATESMTGEINKGDMIIYERYEDQHIKEGQVIVFLHNKSRIIHRVVEIKHVGNETRYYTKGDANEDRDAGYVTDADIVGLTDLKFAYLGYPTLWLREIIKK